MSAPTARRRRHRGPDHTFLPALAGIVDQTTVDDPCHVMVRVTGPLHPEVELGFRSLDPGSHPFDVVAGFEAPRGLGGVRSAHHRTSAPRRGPILAAPAGREHVPRRSPRPRGIGAALRRRGAGAPRPCRGHRPGPLPTGARDAHRTRAPHHRRPVDRGVARSTGRSGQPGGRLSTWAELAGLHPAVQPPSPPDLQPVNDPASLASIARRHAEGTTWHDLRHAPHPLPLPDGPLPVDIARWMDDGFFARWVIGAFPRSTPP